MNHLYLNIDKLAKFAAEFSFIFPAALYVLLYRERRKTLQVLLTACYIVAILMVTVVLRPAGAENRQMMVPFWSYKNIRIDGIRWQIYINIFLFVPLGFMLPWATKRTFQQTILIGCLFSIFIETIQYLFCLGLCEPDDVLHNTLGAAIGYWYWHGFERITEKLQTRK